MFKSRVVYLKTPQVLSSQSGNPVSIIGQSKIMTYLLLIVPRFECSLKRISVSVHPPNEISGPIKKQLTRMGRA